VLAALKNGNNCPYCANQKTCLENSLFTTHPDIAKEWHPDKNQIECKAINAGSHKKVWWLCLNKHEWQASVSNRTRNGRGCPKCLRKTEQRVREIFEKIFQVGFPSSMPSWLINPKTKCRLQLDGYSEYLKLAFEYDGEWHDSKHPKAYKRNSLEYQKEKDSYKDELCKRKGVTLVRIHHSHQHRLRAHIIEKLVEHKLLEDQNGNF